MKKIILSAFVFSLFLGVSHAAEIQNLRVLPADRSLVIEWDQLGENDLHAADGYALQWSDRQSDIRNDKVARHFLNTSQNNLTIRSADFEYDRDYFFRVYTYRKDDRDTILGNGSKILKWRWDYRGEVETNNLEPSDVDLGESSSSGIDEEFGYLRFTPYDTYVLMAWSRPNLAASEFDGFAIEISTTNSFSSPLVALKTDRNDYEGRINGLDPETEYYARGYFYKTRAGEDMTFGDGIIGNFRTQKKFTASQLARMERLRDRGLLRDRVSPSAQIWVPGTEDDEATPAEEEDEEETTPDEESEDEGTQSDSSSGSATALRAKIRSVEQQIDRLQEQLRDLQAQLRRQSSTTTTTPTRSAVRSRSGGRSIQDYLRELLMRKRNSR